MADKLMYFPNDYTLNFPLRMLKLVAETFKPTNQNSFKSPKLLSQQIRKRYYKTLGTSIINRQLSPLSLCSGAHDVYLCKFRQISDVSVKLWAIASANLLESQYVA